jgi:hypothetical protein
MDGDGGRVMRRIGRSNRKEGKEQWRKFRGENFITCTLNIITQNRRRDME